MEPQYHKFKLGPFGMGCDDDQAKRDYAKYKRALRRLKNTEPDSYWRRIYYLRHKQMVDDIDGVETKVKELDIPTQGAFDRINNKYNRAQYLQTKIDLDNALLLTDIYKIYKRVPEPEHPNIDYIVNRNWKTRLDDTVLMAQENCEMYKRLEETKPAVTTTVEHSRWYDKQYQHFLRHANYPPYKNSRLCAPYEEVAWQRAKDIPKPVVYMDMEVLGKGVGRIAFELRADIAPMTVENFRSLCTGDRGKSYRCTEITQMLHGIFWQGGDGITSIYGETFPNENFKMKHDAEGILSMVNYGDKTANSEFRISSAPLPPLNGRQVAFGKVIVGMYFLKQLHRLAGVTDNGKPKTKIVITGCGETTLDEVMEIDPPMTMEEQRIASELRAIIRRREAQEHKSKFDRDFDEIPMTRSYSDINIYIEDEKIRPEMEKKYPGKYEPKPKTPTKKSKSSVKKSESKTDLDKPK